MLSRSLKGQVVMLRWICFALILGVCVSAAKQKQKKVTPVSFSRGWGVNISWIKNYEEGLLNIATSQKPLMVIHHKVDCPHSRALKKLFAADKAIQKMAKEDFIMLNMIEDTTDKNMAPDGYYVPRILFVDPSMTVRTDIVGKHKLAYSYGPEDMENLAENMRKAKALMQHTEL
ncbi:anterior gradient protein 3-like isoform X1 [Cottoperca gobio]|uniref:Anterior gradient protein 3-like isoform X1 n=2 Tax=Cottoperca gobio TaxID=56716 RepID=A0A6J2RX24_COTGO|nr:anterior gradient protein 3-like isoform X1 [Cottoperca gobio]